MAYAGREFCELRHSATNNLRHLYSSQDTLDVIGIWGTRMVDIGDGEGIG